VLGGHVRQQREEEETRALEQADELRLQRELAQLAAQQMGGLPLVTEHGKDGRGNGGSGVFLTAVSVDKPPSHHGRLPADVSLRSSQCPPTASSSSHPRVSSKLRHPTGAMAARQRSVCVACQLTRHVMHCIRWQTSSVDCAEATHYLIIIIMITALAAGHPRPYTARTATGCYVRWRTCARSCYTSGTC
jgi:hypothetical protein